MWLGVQLSPRFMGIDLKCTRLKSSTHNTWRICQYLKWMGGPVSMEPEEGNDIRILQLPWIVHRDIKPSNLVVTRKGKIKLIDFGAATDLRIGKNYVPNRGLLDPDYYLPELYVMPEETPKPPPEPIAAILSLILWQNEIESAHKRQKLKASASGQDGMTGIKDLETDLIIKVFGPDTKS